MITVIPIACSDCDGLFRGLFDRIGDGDEAEELIVTSGPDHRLGLALQTLCLLRQRVGDVNLFRFEEAPFADANHLALDPGLDAAAGRALEIGDLREFEAFFLRLIDNGPGERVLGLRFDRRRQAQQIAGLHAVRRLRIDHRGLALGERTGLVGNEVSDLLGALDGFGIS